MLCSSGFYVSWYVSLQCIRNSQKEVITNSDYQKDKIINFVVSKQDLENNADISFDSQNEFEYKDLMYDVINKKVIGDSVYINCISDNEEDNLKNIVFSQILKTGNNNTGRELPILKFHLDHYTLHTKSNSFASSSRETGQHYQKRKCDILPAPYLNIASPPPWFFA